LSSDLRALMVFFTPLLGILLVVWMNVRFVRSHIGKWNSRFTILFVLSLGQFRQKQKEVWRLRAGYDETEANIIIKYQILCLLEISLGFIISILARHHFLHP
jgi:DMSO reductase anchor subunit